MNFDLQQQALLDWYVEMSKSPATRAYAWGQVKALAANWPQFYGELPAKLTAAMQKAQQGTSQSAGGDNASKSGQCGVTEQKAIAGGKA